MTGPSVRKDQALNSFQMNGAQRKNEREINKLGYCNWYLPERRRKQ